LFAFGLNRALVFLTTLTLARLLLSQDVGVVAAGMTVVLFFEIALDLGVGAAVVYEQHKEITSHVQTAFTMNMLAAAGLTAAGVLVAPWLTEFFHLLGHQGLFRALFLYLLIRGAGQVQDSILRRDLRFGRRMRLDLTRGWSGPWCRSRWPLPAPAPGRWWSVYWPASWPPPRSPGFWCPSVPLSGLSAAPAESCFGSVSSCWPSRSSMRSVSTPTTSSSAIDLALTRWAATGYRLPELLSLNVFWLVSSVAFPAYSKVRVSGGDSFGPAMLRTLQILTLYAFPVGIGLALMARDLVVVLFGTQWLPAVGPMQLVALAAACASVGYASGDIYSARGKPGTLLRINAPVAVAMVTVMYVLAPRGITAVAAVHLCGSVGYAVLRLHLANCVVGTTMRQTLGALRPALSVAAGMAAFVLPLRLSLPAGSLSLACLGLAAVTGGALGLFVGGRSAAGELVGLARAVRSG